MATFEVTINPRGMEAFAKNFDIRLGSVRGFSRGLSSPYRDPEDLVYYIITVVPTTSGDEGKTKLEKYLETLRNERLIRGFNDTSRPRKTTTKKG